MARAGDTQKAERLNLARTLLREYEHLPKAVEHLASSCAISKRQAYRYIEQAQKLKAPVPIGEVKVAFTVKLPPSLIQRVRMYAATTGLALSEIVSRGLMAILSRGGGRG